MKVFTIFGEEEIVSKVCITCGEEKPLDEFHVRTKKYNGEPVGNDCKECKTKKIQQVARLKKQIRFSQDTVCDICERTRDDFGARYKGNPFCVDHDHQTGELRGILCMDCNTGLARYYDNVDTLERAIDYLRKWNNNNGSKYIQEAQDWSRF